MSDIASTITINNKIVRDNRTKLQKFFGYCPHCKRLFKKVEAVNTLSLDSKESTFIGCPICIDDCDDYWRAVWSEL